MFQLRSILEVGSVKSQNRVQILVNEKMQNSHHTSAIKNKHKTSEFELTDYLLKHLIGEKKILD